MSKNVDIGPWPLGEDNVHYDTDTVFQQGKRGEQRLFRTSNIHLRDDGWPVRRDGTLTRLAPLAARSLFSGAGRLLMQDGGTIYDVDPTQMPWVATPLVTNLSPDDPVKFIEHAGQVFWLNKFATGRILADGTAANWGLPVAPSPTMTPLVGSLCPGTYMAAATFVDAYGIEHGANEARISTVGDSECSGPGPTTGFTLDMPSVDPRAAKINVYLSQANGTELFFAFQADPSDFPVKVTRGGDVPWSYDELDTQGLHPPIPGDGLFSHRGGIVTYTDNMLFASLGPAVHLFEVGTAVEARPSPILAGAGLIDGFWTVTRHGAFWTTGNTPDEWDTSQKDARAYAAGTIVVSGRFFDFLDTIERIAYFVSDEGLVAGLPGGSLVPVSKDRFHFDVIGKTASFMVCEQHNIHQVLFTLH